MSVTKRITRSDNGISKEYAKEDTTFIYTTRKRKNNIAEIFNINELNTQTELILTDNNNENYNINTNINNVVIYLNSWLKLIRMKFKRIFKRKKD
jgi:hypothetical protein